MHRSILSATVFTQDGAPPIKIKPAPGINILFGKHAESVFFAIAGIFGICPREELLPIFARVQAEIRWPDGVIYGVMSGDESCSERGIYLEYITTTNSIIGDAQRLAKRFHKRCFRDAGNSRWIFLGELQSLDSKGESELLLKEVYRFLQAVAMQEHGRPLFLCNFLERLDEGIDLRPIFETLTATGRQVFIAVPHYYQINVLEEIPYDTAIHTL